METVNKLGAKHTVTSCPNVKIVENSGLLAYTEKEKTPLTFEAAKSTVDYSNKEHPDIDHWVSVASLDFEQAQRMKLYPRTQPWLDEAM